MISKKKVTALALAGLFVTPVLADTYVPDNSNSNSILSGDGYLTADDTLFSKALKNSRNRTDSSKDAVKLSMWGKHNDPNKDGLTELKLSSGKTYDSVSFILFADNSVQDNPIHSSSFSLDKTNLTLSRGILFRNASNSIETNQAGTYDPNKVKKDLQNRSKLTLNDQSSLTGNVINQFNTQIEGLKDNGKYYYYQIGLVNNTEVSLTSSRWTGDLKDEINLNGTSLGEAVNKEDALSKNVISLKNGSIWTGGVDVAEVDGRRHPRRNVVLDGEQEQQGQLYPTCSVRVPSGRQEQRRDDRQRRNSHDCREGFRAEQHWPPSYGHGLQPRG